MQSAFNWIKMSKIGKRIINFTLTLVQHPVILIFLWLGAALKGFWISWFGNYYNNYFIFSQSFYHALDQLPLYREYPNEYFDIFLYGIPFTILIAPFAIMPPMIGGALWCLLSALLLYYAIKKIELEKWKLAIIIWLSFRGLYESFIPMQFNAATTAFILLTFILIEKKKDFWAALFIVIGAMTKIYGIVGLLLFIFSKKRLHFLVGLLVWGIILFVLPMLYSSPHYVIETYQDWFTTLISKNDRNILSLHQNISFIGLIHKTTRWVFKDAWIIFPALILWILPIFRISQYRNKEFRLSFLASILLFFVLFSTGTEESGYIAALIGVGIWFVSTPTQSKTFTLNVCLLLFFVGLTVLSSSSMIYPRRIRSEFIYPYALKALPCFIIWLKIIWEQLTQNYSHELPTPISFNKKQEYIDIVLPCYNPHEGWEHYLIKKCAELERMLSSRRVRLIVVNDGSKHGFTNENVQTLLAALPQTIIVNNAINKGKGAAVRAGIAHSDSKLALYTDYDFPYQIDSICQVVQHLEAGYDIVVASRNYTYYSQLSGKRKLASFLSRFINLVFLGLTHTDTQAGLKGFNNKGKAILASTRIDQFLFDTEFIYKASLDNIISIKDVQVELRSGVFLPNIKKGVFINELKNLLSIYWRN